MPGVDQTYVPTKFQWSQNWGNHVCMAGSFDPPIPTWSPLEMKKNKDNIYELTLDLLPDKKYYFKFVIDGNWILDQGLHSCPDSSGNYNHEIQVNLPPRPPTPVIVEQQQEVEDVKVDEENNQVIVTETETTEEHNQVIIEDHKEVHHHDHPAIEDNKIEHQEDHIVDEEQIQHQGDHHENNQHQEEQVVQEQVVVEEQVVVVEELVVVEEQVIVVQEQVVEEQHHHQEDHQIVTEDHHADENKQQYLEGQVEEIKEEQHHHQEDHIVTEDHHADEVVEEIKEQQHHHQEDHHIAAGTDENKQQYQEEQVDEVKEEQIQHQEDLQVVEDLHEHHHEDEQKEQDVTDMNTTEQSRDDTVTNVSISEAIETETITMVEQSDLSKETMIESDNDKLSAEHVANTTDNVIIEGTHDESMTTESDETLHTPQDDTDKVTEISEIERPNIEQSDSEIKITENNEIKVTENNEIKVTENNEIKVTEETSSIVEKHETVVSSTTETEIPIESSTDEIKVEGEGEKYEHKRETMNENEDDDYDDYKDEGAEDSENTIVVYEENLNEETLKEVLLNNTWAKDDNSLEDCIPSSWTEVHQSQSVIWPDDTNLKWSDINKETSDETEETETTNKLETEVEDYLDYLEHETNDEEEVVSCEISSTVLVEETITVKPGSIVEEIFAQSIVGSHIEKESDEIGINNKVPTEPSFAQYEKPESSATADKNISALLSIPTTVVAEAAVEQHSYLDEEKAIDNSEMEDVLQDNISRKIISISPNASSPGESTRNADIYPRITVATNTSLSETVNIKSKHKKPVVEITSRGILQKDSKTIIQDEEEEEKIDLVNISYLVTSVTTTFTLGVISMLYKSVFKPRNQ